MAVGSPFLVRVVNAFIDGVENGALSFIAWILQYFGWHSVISYGADPTGFADSTAAFQAALDVVGPHHVRIPKGTYLITDELRIEQHRVTVGGAGSPGMVILNFVPTTDGKACLKVGLTTAAIISLVRIENLRITSSNTTLQKIGIQITDGSETIVKDVVIGPSGSWIGGTPVAPSTTGSSIGIKVRGREFGTFRNITSCANFPLWIATDPNAATISIDHHNFDGCYFIVQGGDGASVYIEPNVVLTNTVIQNGGWVAGSYGLYWVDTTSTSASLNLIIRNVRPEQLVGGQSIRISKNSLLFGLNIEDVITGPNGGVFLRNVTFATFNRFQYNAGSGVALDLDGGTVDWKDSFVQTGATVTLGTLLRVRREGFFGAGYPMALNEFLFPPSGLANGGDLVSFLGVRQWAATGTLASGATVAIPQLQGSLVQGRIQIAFRGATKDGSFSVAINSNRAVEESTTDATMTDVGNVASKLCLHWSSASACVLRNNFAESITYSYVYFFN